MGEIVDICADYCGIVASKHASDQSALTRALEYDEGKAGFYRWLENKYPCIKITVGVGPTQDSDDSETPRLDREARPSLWRGPCHSPGSASQIGMRDACCVVTGWQAKLAVAQRTTRLLCACRSPGHCQKGTT